MSNPLTDAPADIESKLRSIDETAMYEAPATTEAIIAEAADTIATLRKQVSDAVGAMEPFANAAITYIDAPDNRPVKAKHVIGLLFGDFRRARTVLATLTGGKAE